jgi:hypothetical protein
MRTGIRCENGSHHLGIAGVAIPARSDREGPSTIRLMSQTAGPDGTSRGDGPRRNRAGGSTIKHGRAARGVMAVPPVVRRVSMARTQATGDEPGCCSIVAGRGGRSWRLRSALR